jgi:hypothetical protein
MLPPLPTPAGLRRPLAQLVLVLSLLLPLALMGCSGSGQPAQRVLLDALALQIQLTQVQVSTALGLESAAGVPQVSRVRVEEQQSLRIGDARGLRLAGRFDWRLSGDAIRVDSPFELYLQRGERNESWRLAQPSGGSDDGRQDWITHPLPLPGARRTG